MTATLKDVVLGTPAGKMAMEEAMKKSSGNTNGIAGGCYGE